MENRAGIDIIIPVYNALEDLKLCVESLKKHTDLRTDRLIFVEDKSSDTKVLPYLRGLVGPGIVLLENEENQGFSGSINRGLQYSDRDVILLNTDTIVTRGWVDKMAACAYSDSSIGTVTPFSNNATLCSTPNFCEENVLPEGHTIDSYAAVIERCSMKRYPRITVAVGFCMLIKREVIEKVGLFDKETFQRGYGEENDFCFRAEQLGYHQVLCDDTYIYHSGTVSFLSEEKMRLIREHEKILQKRYPIQVQRNAEYVRDNPEQYLRDNIALHEKLAANGRRGILYVLHSDFREDADDHIGGTQFHVRDLMEHLRADFNVFVAARDGAYLRLTAYLADERISLKFHIGPKEPFQPIRSSSIAAIFRNILAAFPIDVVHVHQVKDVSFDVFFEAKEQGLPLIVTLHDYYYICPTVTLLERESRYCHGAEGAKCAACLAGRTSYSDRVDYIRNWRETAKEVLGLCDLLILPSEAAKKVYLSHYPGLEGKMRVVSHGEDRPVPVQEKDVSTELSDVEWRIEGGLQPDCTIVGWAFQRGVDSAGSEISLEIEDKAGHKGVFHSRRVCRPDVAEITMDNAYFNCGFKVCVPDMLFSDGPLSVRPLIKNNGKCYRGGALSVNGYKKAQKRRRRVAFIGGLNRAKGSQFAFHMIKKDEKYDWFVFGGIGDPELEGLEKNNLRKTGWYNRDDIEGILQGDQIDLVCILPIWPETFCYTLSEALMAGVPVLATDIGAVGERVRADGTGWLIPPEASVQDALTQIGHIFDSPDAYEAVLKNVREYRHRPIADMVGEYAGIYRDMAAPEPKTERGSWDRKMILNAYMDCAPDASAVLDDSADLRRRVGELENALRSVTDAPEYKLLHILREKNFPGKRLMRKMLLIMYGIYRRFKGR